MTLADAAKPPGAVRLFTGLFLILHADQMGGGQVAPIPALLQPGVVPSFGSVCYGSHLESKVLNNFELEPQASFVGEA